MYGDTLMFFEVLLILKNSYKHLEYIENLYNSVSALKSFVIHIP